MKAKEMEVAFCAPAVDQKETRRHSMDKKMTGTQITFESR